MNTFLKNTWRNPFAPLAIVFLLLHFIVTQDGGQNAASRLLSMRAVVESGTFSIDPYLKSTDDWALAPNGKYYSNKAPGTILLGLPIFFVADEIHRPFEQTPADGIRPQPEYFQSTTVSFFLQTLPFAILVLLVSAWMMQSWISAEAAFFFLFAALFGNTAIIFMNSYFGHGLSAVLQLSGLFLLFRKKFGWSGFFFSLSLLADYAFAFQIPALLVALFLARPKKEDLLQFVSLAIPGAIAWSLYHGLIFGSPFVVASKFQNPVFLDAAAEKFWGMFALPHGPWIWELLFGGSRGLIVQQPWIFLVAPLTIFAIYQDRRKKDLLVLWAFCVLGITGLIFMNASFNGWHGGATAGPRYLAGILPCFALLGALTINALPRKMRWLLWAALALAVLFRGLMYGGTILAPVEPLWEYYWREFLSRGTPKLRAGIFFLLVVGAFYWSKRRLQQTWV
jgi:hypothetical protein